MVILNLEVWNKFCVTKMTLMFAFLALNTNNSCTALSFVTWTNKSSKTGRFKDHKFLEWPQNFAKYSSTFDYTVQQNRRRRRAAAARRITTCPPTFRKPAVSDFTERCKWTCDLHCSQNLDECSQNFLAFSEYINFYL
jgi:hypothetical protein